MSFSFDTVEPAPEQPIVSRKNAHIMRAQFLEEASAVITNPAILINMVSRRVRQLTLGHRPLIEVSPRMTSMDIALKEVADGKLTYEEVAEPTV